jgi:hypothetical protein
MPKTFSKIYNFNADDKHPRSKREERKPDTILEIFKFLIAPQGVADYYGPVGYDAEFFDKRLVKTTIVNYIKQLSSAALEHIQELDSTAVKHIKEMESASVPSFYLMGKPKVKYILTVPSMWSEEYNAMMREVAVLAHLAAKEDDVTLITEPEAATLFFYETIQKLGPSGSYFIICDAGGSIVDLTTFATGIEDKSKKTFIKQVGEGCGNLYGSNRINLKLNVYLKSCFPNDFIRKQGFLGFIANIFEKEKVLQSQIY